MRELWPDTVRIIISGYTDSQDIIAGINDAGIYQYVLKPWMPEHLLSTVGRAAEARRLQMQTQRLNLELRTSTPVLRQRTSATLATARAAFGFDRLVRAPAARSTPCAKWRRVARYDLAVLITGESGTGKELLARAIHYASPRAERAFVLENCAAMSETLLESELFGHKRGAFTGAFEDHVGLFQRADGGTIFWTKLATPPRVPGQAAARAARGRGAPGGRQPPVAVDVRVIAATHRDLEQDVRSGRFREDLYYRIASMTLTVPPLRERSADVLPIADMLLGQACQELARPALAFSPEVRASLLAYPGRATSASSRTRYTAPSPCPRARRSRRPRFRAACCTASRVPALRQPGCRFRAAAACRSGWTRSRPPSCAKPCCATAGTRRTPPRNWAFRAWACAKSLPASGWRARPMAEPTFNVLWLQSAGAAAAACRCCVPTRADFAAQLRQLGIHLLWHPSLSLATGEGPCRCSRTAWRAAPLARTVHRRRRAARAGRHRALSPAGGHAAAHDGLGAQAQRRGAPCGGRGQLRGLWRHQRGRQQPHRRLRPAVRGRPVRRPVGRRLARRAGLPVVNVAGCPTHPGWVLETLAALADGAQPFGAEQLDSLGRPRAYCDQLAHHGCARNEFYEYKASAEKPSDLGCLMEHMGCKGHAGARRLQYPPVERRRLLRARRLRLHQLHRAWFRGAGPSVPPDTQGRGHSHRSAYRHAQGLVRGAGLAVQVGHAGACQAQCHGGPCGRGPMVRKRQD